MPLSPSDVFAADDRPIIPFAVPEWGGDVLLRCLSAGQVDQITALPLDAPRAKRSALRFALVDESGNPCYSIEQIERLFAEKKQDVVLRVVMKVNEICGWAKPDEDDVKN